MRGSASRRAIAGALAALVLAVGGCAEILGLDDPAGRLGEGGAGATGTGTAAGGTGTDGVGTGGAAPGAGGGPATGTSSTGTGTSTSTSTGAGGGGGADGGSPGALELPTDFTIDALGTSDDGAVALVRWTGNVDGALCGAAIAPGHLAAVAIEGPGCEVLTTASGSNILGFSIDQRGPWLALAASGTAGTITVHTESPMSVQLDTGGAGAFGVWEVGSEGAGFLVGTAFPLMKSRIVPRDDGSALVLQTTLQFGFTGDSGCAPAGAPTDSPQVHFTVLGPAAEDCAHPRVEADGTLLDVAEADVAWSLILSAGNCNAFPPDGTASLPFGSCSGTSHLLAVSDDGPDDVYLGTNESGPCAAAALSGNLTGEALPLWCDEVGFTETVIPFLADDTHVRFVENTNLGAALWRLAIDGGATDAPLSLCSGCLIHEARVSNGRVYLSGTAGESIELFGESIAAGSAFWAWIPLEAL